MNVTPLISVVLCTYNNADSLAITLSQLRECTLKDSSSVEILVVDNNSSDHTRDIVEQITVGSEIIIRYLFEPTQGLSNARNLGLSEAAGQYLLFTDDDADLPANWLECYQSQIEETGADCLYSKIKIIWNRCPPWWFDKRYNPFFVHLDYGDERIAVRDIHHEFFGKNFCCRKSMLRDMGGFDEKLGRKGSSLAAGEETIIYRKLIEQQMNVFYFPGAVVGHRLKAIEYTEKNIEKKFVDGAMSSFLIANEFASRHLFGRPIRPLLIAIKNILYSILITSIRHLSNSNKGRKNTFYWTLIRKRSLRLLNLWISSP